jgi:hypothetical protein
VESARRCVFRSFCIVCPGRLFFFLLLYLPENFCVCDAPPPAIVHTIKTNPLFASAVIDRGVSYGEDGQIVKACRYLQLACGSGYCEKYDVKKNEGVCQ